jgi:hypothetical protein
MPIEVDLDVLGSSVALNVPEVRALSKNNVPTAVPTKTKSKPWWPLGHGPEVHEPRIQDNDFPPQPILPREELVAREEVTLLPAAGIYSALVGDDATIDDDADKEHRGKDENDPIMLPLPATRRPLYTLPVETPTYEVWRRNNDQESDSTRSGMRQTRYRA